jgi:hypothetical protein
MYTSVAIGFPSIGVPFSSKKEIVIFFLFLESKFQCIAWIRVDFIGAIRHIGKITLMTCFSELFTIHTFIQ